MSASIAADSGASWLFLFTVLAFAFTVALCGSRWLARPVIRFLGRHSTGFERLAVVLIIVGAIYVAGHAGLSVR